MKKLTFMAIMALLLYGCKKENHITRSFCYWKTIEYGGINYGSDADSIKLQHLYMRLFDVDWNPYAEAPLPVATSWSFADDNNRMEITPSIYITNKVVLNSSRQQLIQLAHNIAKRVDTIVTHTRKKAAEKVVYSYDLGSWEARDSCIVEEEKIFDTRIHEILIDCDWTQKSQGNYFFLLREIKKAIPKYNIAATIRLWQYRDYELAGIPPVDRGLLMCYNMGDIKKRETENSIATSEELKKYITHNDYPLKLDVALPLFQWAVAFRGNEILGIIPEDVDLNSSYLKKTDGTHYRFVADEVIGETYYREGDEMRVEQISDVEVKKMIGIVKDNVDLENSRVTFFSWDDKIIESYGTKTISGYYALFVR
ncbi:hypothetical protein ACLI1A_16075 [Flavobacterium sp. RHBU_3]|uniref:hypothetical protein n=1 Tax=Flavobacterium sp. RHBU_3 TaxID=3391184 RepID=UPI003984D76A